MLKNVLSGATVLYEVAGEGQINYTVSLTDGTNTHEDVGDSSITNLEHYLNHLITRHAYRLNKVSITLRNAHNDMILFKYDKRQCRFVASDSAIQHTTLKRCVAELWKILEERYRSIQIIQALPIKLGITKEDDAVFDGTLFAPSDYWVALGDFLSDNVDYVPNNAFTLTVGKTRYCFAHTKEGWIVNESMGTHWGESEDQEAPNALLTPGTFDVCDGLSLLLAIHPNATPNGIYQDPMERYAEAGKLIENTLVTLSCPHLERSPYTFENPYADFAMFVRMVTTYVNQQFVANGAKNKFTVEVDIKDFDTEESLWTVHLTFNAEYRRWDITKHSDKGRRQQASSDDNLYTDSSPLKHYLAQRIQINETYIDEAIDYERYVKDIAAHSKAVFDTYITAKRCNNVVWIFLDGVLTFTITALGVRITVSSANGKMECPAPNREMFHIILIQNLFYLFNGMDDA